MTAPILRPATRERLLLWVMHRFAEAFDQHAVLKGGLALRLFDSPRLTHGIDYVLVPYSGKKDILPGIERILRELPGGDVKITLHSTMVRALLRLDEASIEVECSVAQTCPSIPMATAALADAAGQPSQVIRIMEPTVALAHKLAAWNERRMVRDLYDAYFYVARLGVLPDSDTLASRLEQVRSRRPEMRGKRRMSVSDLESELVRALDALSQADIDEELGGLLAVSERAGLHLRIRAALRGMLSQVGSPSYESTEG